MMNQSIAEYNVKDIQCILKKMMNEFLRICHENNIKYYLVKGGLIGAIKYKGFIPWDPDVDFAIPFYEKTHFCEVFNKELKKPFKLYFFDSDINYEYLFPRIGIEGVDYRQLHLDIFILTFCPNEEQEQIKYLKKISRIELLNTFRNSNIKRPINNIFNRIVLIISRICIFWIPKNYVRKKYNKIISEFNDTDFYIQVGAVDEYKEKYIMPRSWFGDGVKREFDSFLINTPQQSLDYLEKMYPSFLDSLPKEEDMKRQQNRKWHLNKDIIEDLLNG